MDKAKQNTTLFQQGFHDLFSQGRPYDSMWSGIKKMEAQIRKKVDLKYLQSQQGGQK